MLALHGTHQSLKSHAGVNDVHRELFERSVGFTVELHEDEIPYLYYLRVVFVYEFAPGNFGLLFVGTRVEVNLRTGTAWTCITHFPKVVVLVSVDYVVGRYMLCPNGCGFVVAFEIFFLRTFEYGYVEVFRIEFEHVYQILPCHVDGTFLEIVAETPVAQHLEHRVMIGVMSHLFQVVVLSAYAQTLLRVGTAAWFGLACAQNDVFPLVHSGICKH